MIIQIPVELNVGQFVSELIMVASPFVGIAFLIASGMVVMNIMDIQR